MTHDRTILVASDEYSTNALSEFEINLTDAISPFRFSYGIFEIRSTRTPRELDWFAALAEEAFAEDWDSAVDAIYDGL